MASKRVQEERNEKIRQKAEAQLKKKQEADLLKQMKVKEKQERDRILKLEVETAATMKRAEAAAKVVEVKSVIDGKGIDS
jgi:hypothetical protein